MRHKFIKNTKTFQEVTSTIDWEYVILFHTRSKIIELYPADRNVRPNGAREVSLEWIKGYLYTKDLEPSTFEKWYKNICPNLGSFDEALMDLFILGSQSERMALIKTFPDKFNPGDQLLEW